MKQLPLQYWFSEEILTGDDIWAEGFRFREILAKNIKNARRIAESVSLFPDSLLLLSTDKMHGEEVKRNSIVSIRYNKQWMSKSTFLHLTKI